MPWIDLENMDRASDLDQFYPSRYLQEPYCEPQQPRDEEMPRREATITINPAITTASNSSWYIQPEPQRPRRRTGMRCEFTSYQYSEDVNTFLLELQVINHCVGTNNLHRINDNVRLDILTYEAQRPRGARRRRRERPFANSVQYVTAKIVTREGRQVGGRIRFTANHLGSFPSHFFRGTHPNSSLQPLPSAVIPWDLAEGVERSEFRPMHVPHGCQNCGRRFQGNREPWHTNGNCLCRPCYDQTLNNRIECADCSRVLNPWDAAEAPNR